MNLNFFQKYTEGRLNTTDGDGCQNLKMLLNDIKIDYVKTGSQRYKDYLYAKDFKLNKSIEIEDGFNFDGMNTIDYYKSNLKDAENVYEIKSETNSSESNIEQNNFNSNIFENFDGKILSQHDETKPLTINDLISEYTEKYNNSLYRILNDYMKKHKHSLNVLLLNRIKESEEFLSDYKASKENIIDTNNIFNTVSLRKFWKFLGKDKQDLNFLPLTTKIKIFKELKKINTRSKNSAWIYTLYLTTSLSCIISLALYKNFSSDIRNKRKFFYRYVMKVPFIIMITSYFIIKNILLTYYIRQPLINLNEIFCEVDCEKEKRNQTMNKLRLKLGNSDKLIHSKVEYEKMIKCLNIIKEDKENIKNKTDSSIIPKFYLLSYKFLMLNLHICINKEIISAKEYIDSLSRCEIEFRISYLNKIILFYYFEKSLDKLFKKEFNSREPRIKKNIDNPDDAFKIKLSIDIEKNKKTTYNNNFENCLINMRSLHYDKLISSRSKTDLLMKVFIFDTVTKFLYNNKYNEQISYLIKIYEIYYHLTFLKKFEIRKIISDIMNYNMLVSEDSEAEEFFNFLTKTKNRRKNKTNIHIPNEYFTINEIYLLDNEKKFLFKNKVNNLCIHSFLLPTVSSIALLMTQGYL